MSLVSPPFALYCAAVVVLFYRVPPRRRGLLLLIASILFYAFWQIAYVPLLAVITGMFYLIGQRIAVADNTGKRAWLISGVTVSLVTLFGFQYLEFFSGISSPLPVPVGISFYTFVGIGYLVDIFRGTFTPTGETNAPGRFALLLSFFPTVTSGPIERAGHLLPQITSLPEVTFDDNRTVAAFRLILWGVFKKLVIADRLAIYVNAVYDQPQGQPGMVLLIATLFYTFQLYADFSGYTDVALGVARLFNLNLLANFRQPYFAMSVREFWQRWHISLSTWIRDYMFMPLSRTLLRRTGGRYPRWIQGGSNLVVMILVGLWHGPSWTFVIWGTLHGLYMSVESILNWRVAIPKPTSNRQRLTKYARTALTFTLIVLAWVFFRANSVNDAGYILTHLLDFSGDLSLSTLTAPFAAGVFQPHIEFTLALLLIALLLAADWLDQNRGLLTSLERQRGAVRWAVYYALGVGIMVALIYGTGSQEFIYFRF